MHGAIPACLHAAPEAAAWRQAGITPCTNAFVSGLPLPARRRQPGSNLGHAEVFFRETLLQEMLGKDATRKPARSPRITIAAFIKAVLPGGSIR